MQSGRTRAQTLPIRRILSPNRPALPSWTHFGSPMLFQGSDHWCEFRAEKEEHDFKTKGSARPLCLLLDAAGRARVGTIGVSPQQQYTRNPGGPYSGNVWAIY